MLCEQEVQKRSPPAHFDKSVFTILSKVLAMALEDKVAKVHSCPTDSTNTECNGDGGSESIRGVREEVVSVVLFIFLNS